MTPDSEKESATSPWKERLTKIQSELTFNENGLDKNGDTLAYHLFKAGAPDAFMVEAFGALALHVALAYQSEDFHHRLPALLAAGADPNEAVGSWNALHLTAFLGTASQVAILLKAGADLHALNENDENALDVAIRNQNSETIRVLEACGLERRLDATLPTALPVPPRSSSRPRM